MLRKVVKVQKFPPDRPCDSLTAGGGKKKNLQTEKKNAASMLFFLITGRSKFGGFRGTCVAAGRCIGQGCLTESIHINSFISS